MGNLLLPLSSKLTPCKICGNIAAPYGSVDFNKSCNEVLGIKRPLSGLAIPYQRCLTCSFVYTNAFDDWRTEEFSAHIYNDEYLEVDPHAGGHRAMIAAQYIQKLLGQSPNLSLLDYGGGEGFFEANLREMGFTNVTTYDPFVARHAARPTGRFDVVTCFETLEHSLNPHGVVEDISHYIEGKGLVIFSTLMQSHLSEKEGLNWWYIGPRNGHISIYSPQALQHLWHRHGFIMGSSNDNMHAAWHAIPEFAKHFLREGPPPS